MQKLILVQGNYTKGLDEYLNNGWYIKDFKPVSDHALISCGENCTYDRITGNVCAYVLLEKVDLRKPGRRVLNEHAGYTNAKPVKGEMLDDCD